MRIGLIERLLAAFSLALHKRRDAQGNRNLSKLDEHLLDDLGLTREQADQIDQSWEDTGKQRTSDSDP